MLRRTLQIYNNQRSRSREAGHWIEYTVEQLRSMVNAAVRKGLCPYCNRELTTDNFSIDHAIPVARNGTWGFNNLVCCCRECNTIKGPLDPIEFKELIQLTNTWNHAAKTNLLARIKAGSRFARFTPSQKIAGQITDETRTRI